MEIYKRKDIPWRVIEENALLVNPKTSLIYPLNTVACRIWQLLDGKSGADEIAGIIKEEFDVEEDVLRPDLAEFILQLKEAGLIEKI